MLFRKVARKQFTYQLVLSLLTECATRLDTHGISRWANTERKAEPFGSDPSSFVGSSSSQCVGLFVAGLLDAFGFQNSAEALSH
jgi:hypothetical protein